LNIVLSTQSILPRHAAGKKEERRKEVTYNLGRYGALALK